MKYSTDTVVQGIINYADNEIMNKLPTSGKWIVGTVIGLGSGKIANIIEELKGNRMVRMLEIVDDSGDIDVDALASAMHNAAERYGKLTLDVPMIGQMSFSSADIDELRRYIG